MAGLRGVGADMAHKQQGAWREYERTYPPGMAMEKYLRDGERDRAVELQEAADRLAELLRRVMEAASLVGKSMPTFGECEDALIAYEAAIEAIKRGNR